MNPLLRTSMETYLKKTAHVIFLGAMILVGVRAFFLEPGMTDGRSMEPTFIDHEKFLTNKWTLLFREPKRGEILQIRQTNLDETILKRVVGLPGERVKIKDGLVFIISATGEETQLSEPYLPENRKTQTKNHEPFVSVPIPPHQYFVLGDNRDLSTDSRVFGFVHRSHIYGTVLSLSFFNGE